MKLNEDFKGAGNRIRGYEPGQIRINDQTFQSSIVISAETLHPEWSPTSVADLRAAHFELLLSLEPEVILLGTGERQRFPERQLLRELIGHGIGIEVMDTAAACRTYNVLMGEERRVAAGLLLR